MGTALGPQLSALQECEKGENEPCGFLSDLRVFWHFLFGVRELLDPEFPLLAIPSTHVGPSRQIVPGIRRKCYFSWNPQWPAWGPARSSQKCLLNVRARECR